MAVKRWIPLLLVAGFALAGCGQNLAGSAAVVGEQRLTDSQLADAATTLTQRLGIPGSPQVSQALISRWVVAELVDELAARRGVDVTKGGVPGDRFFRCRVNVPAAEKPQLPMIVVVTP